METLESWGHVMSRPPFRAGALHARQETVMRIVLGGTVVGTLLLFVLLPAYLCALIPVMERRTRASLGELDGVAHAEDVAAVKERMQRTSAVVWPAMVLGFLFGLSQNPEFLRCSSTVGQRQNSLPASRIGPRHSAGPYAEPAQSRLNYAIWAWRLKSAATISA